MKRVAIVLGACIFAIYPSLASQLPANYVRVPIVTQGTDYSCGAAVMLSAFAYWDVFDGNESELYKFLKTRPNEGTDPRDMVTAARSLGLEARLQEKTSFKDLQKGIERGETIVIAFQSLEPGAKKRPWETVWDEGHFGIVIGVDANEVYMMDPVLISGYGVIKKSELLPRWHDMENRNGKEWRNHQLAIFIKGQTPRPFMEKLLPIE